MIEESILNHLLNSSTPESEQQYSTHSHMMDLLSIGTPLVVFPSIFIILMRYLGKEKRTRYLRTCAVLINSFLNRGRYTPRNTSNDEFEFKHESHTDGSSVLKDVIK